MSVDAVGDLQKRFPDIFNESNYKGCVRSVVIKRTELQDEYLRNCAGAFTMGEWLAKDLVERCGLPKEKVHHVGGGINLDKTLIDYSKKQGNKFLFVGRDFVRKGGPLVYKAYKLLQKKHPNFELHVAGPMENPYPNDTDPNYHFYGDCPYKKTAELFNLADVFVMPSKFEAYGLVFVEALTFGLPCIGRNAYEMPYLINEGETGYLLKEETPEQLADLMESAITKPELTKNVRARKEEYIVEYSWDKVAERIEQAMFPKK